MAALRIVAGVALAAATLAAAPERWTPLGCWQFAFSPWQPSIASGDEGLYPLPVLLEFTRERTRDGYLLARRLKSDPDAVSGTLTDFQIAELRRMSGDTLWRPQPAEPSRSLSAFWRYGAADSLELFLPTYWSTGIRAKAAQRGDSLTGTALIYVDVAGAPVPRSAFRASRVPCPAT